MCALTYLRQLLWIAKQQQVCGRGRHGDGIGQAELASLVDHQQIQAGFRHPIAVGEVPRRAADHASGGVADEFCVLAPVDRLPAPSGVVVRLFGDLPGSRPALITPSNRFSTVACDWATTPIRQACSVTNSAITRAAVYVLPVPGGPCTARYDESKSSAAAAYR